jgi:hypothetical protein
MPKVEIDYSKTIIYKICCIDPLISDVYVGHTTNFIKRQNGHKADCNNENSKQYNRHVYTFIRDNGGWENWKMIQIEECNCKNKREAESTEHYWIEQLGATLNTNKPFAMCKEDPVTYKKDWYEEKKDYILEKAKQHYEENKEKKLEYQKQYSEEHKEEIAEKQKQYREKNKETLSEKKRIYREHHKEEVKKAQKTWRETNKDKIKQQKSEVINCECGSQYTFGNKSRHLQSKLHVKYQNELCGIIEEESEPTISEEDKIQLRKQKQKEYREKNAEKIKANKQKYIETHKEEIKSLNQKYYAEHKEEIISNNKKYAEDNKEKVKAYKDEWYQKNKEHISNK